MSAVGAWNLNFDRQNLQESVYSALKNGVRLIDTAKYYGNEEEGEKQFSVRLPKSFALGKRFLLQQRLFSQQLQSKAYRRKLRRLGFRAYSVRDGADCKAEHWKKI